MIGTSRFVDYTFSQLDSKYDLKITTNLDSKICEVYEKNNLKAVAKSTKFNNYALYRLEFIREVEDQIAFNIASLCSAVLHSAVMF